MEREPSEDNLKEIKINDELVCIIETVKNPDYRVFHTPFQISDSTINSFFRPLTESDDCSLNKLGETGDEIIRNVFDIKGITSATITAYQLSVMRGACFPWETLESQIIDILYGQQEWAKFKNLIKD